MLGRKPSDISPATAGHIEVAPNLDFKRVTLELQVRRASGEIEDLGVVADSGDLTRRRSLLGRIGAKLCR